MARVKASGFSQGVTRKAYKQAWEQTHVPGAKFDKVAKVKMPTSSSSSNRDYAKSDKPQKPAAFQAMYDEPQVTDLAYPGKGGKLTKLGKI